MPMELSDSEGDISCIGLLLHREEGGGREISSSPAAVLFSLYELSTASLLF